MDNNDILIRLRYALDIRDSEMVKIIQLGGLELPIEDVRKLLVKESETNDRLICTDETLESFLNGLIIYKRGLKETADGKPEKPELAIKSHADVNNVLLKKVKIALSLTSDDMLELFKAAGIEISISELSAVLRKVGQRNYKECGDRYARNFLKGLTIKYRK